MAELTQGQRAKAQEAIDKYNADLAARGIDAFEDEAQQKAKAWEKAGEIHKDVENA